MFNLYFWKEFNLDEQLSDDESDQQNSEQVIQKKIDNVNLDYKIFTTNTMRLLRLKIWKMQMRLQNLEKI